MAGHPTHHAPGHGDADTDTHDANRQPGTYFSPMASQPNQLDMRPGYNTAASQEWGGSPAGTPVGMASPSPGYLPPAQGHMQPQSPGHDVGLAAQMGNISLGADAQTAARRKKKDRHAYHQVDAPPASSQASDNMQAGNRMASDTDPSRGQFAPAMTSQTSHFPPATSPGPGPFRTKSGNVDNGPQSAFVPASGHTSVSPDEIPSIPFSRDSLQPHFLGNMFPTFDRHLPPPATISFLAYDTGNSSPKFARLTMNNIPVSAEGLKSTALPLGLLLQPLAAVQADELAIPVLDFGESGPPRCQRCRAYINPFVMFRSGGNKFVCNLCNYGNDTPPDYFSALSPQGVRLDRDRRPELMRGTVEFVVPEEYWTKAPVGLRYLFVIDVTQESSNKGFLEAFCRGILAALYPSEQDDGAGYGHGELRTRLPPAAKVGFVTFDKEIHFYNLGAMLEQAQMMVMPDIEDPFVPLSEGLFVDPHESKAVIRSLLTRLPQIFSAVKNPEPALLSTLSSALGALESTGGRILCSLSALSTWGPGRLFMRDDGRHPGGEPDKKLFSTEHPAWRKIGDKMVSAGVGVDFFMAAPSGGYLDIATVGAWSQPGLIPDSPENADSLPALVASTTGGETFYYPNFVAPRDSDKLWLEIKHALTRETGYQALMKVRCSNGLQVSAYHGSFVQHTFGADLEIAVIDSDKAVAVTFGYDGKLDAKLDAHFQAALLYTTAAGQRRVRCCNVIAGVSENAKDCLKFIDQDAVYCIIAKEASTRLATTPATLKDIRLGLTERTIDILAGYRKNFLSHSHPSGQLVMPERLKELCMYMLSIIKCRAFKGGNETSDRRVHEMRMIRSMGALELSLYLYPRIIPLHNLQPDDGFPDEKTGHLRIPPAIRASFSRVEPGGVYLVDNGQQCLLWFHAQTSPNLLEDLFGDGLGSLDALDAYTSTLPVLQTHLNAQVRNILEFLRRLRGSKGLTIQLARQGIDGAEYEFARMLVEDRNNEAQSYVDWLVHIHKGVQLELTGQRKREDGGDGGALSNFAGLRPSYW